MPVNDLADINIEMINELPETFIVPEGYNQEVRDLAVLRREEEELLLQRIRDRADAIMREGWMRTPPARYFATGHNEVVAREETTRERAERIRDTYEAAETNTVNAEEDQEVLTAERVREIANRIDRSRWYNDDWFVPINYRSEPLRFIEPMRTIETFRVAGGDDVYVDMGERPQRLEPARPDPYRMVIWDEPTRYYNPPVRPEPLPVRPPPPAPPQHPYPEPRTRGDRQPVNPMLAEKVDLFLAYKRKHLNGGVLMTILHDGVLNDAAIATCRQRAEAEKDNEALMLLGLLNKVPYSERGPFFDFFFDMEEERAFNV